MAKEGLLQDGDVVRCLAGSIDRDRGTGAVGRVTNFARFSPYHPHEAFVVFDDRPTDNGWFWVRDLAPARVRDGRE